MSFAVWTYLAIAVLVFGAPLVFAWFLGEAADLLRGLGRSREGEAGRETRPR